MDLFSLLGDDSPVGDAIQDAGDSAKDTPSDRYGDALFGAADTAYDTAFAEHPGDVVLSGDRYRRFGLNTAVGAMFQEPKQIERRLGVPSDYRGDTVRFSGPGVTNQNPTAGPVFEYGSQGEFDRNITHPKILQGIQAFLSV